MSQTLDTISNYAVPIIATAVTGNPAVGAAAAGANNYRQNKDIKSALFSAGGNYFGGKIGGSLFPNAGTVGESIFDAAPGGTISNFAQNAIPSSLANATIGETAGSYFGGNVLPEMLGASQDNSSPQMKSFQPTQQAELERPASLSGFSSLAPNQESTNIATQGVYGGGQGPSEQEYFLNLINRRLVDDAGNVDQDFGDIAPIESSYLDMLGYGGYNNVNSLLEAIAGYKA